MFLYTICFSIGFKGQLFLSPSIFNQNCLSFFSLQDITSSIEIWSSYLIREQKMDFITYVLSSPKWSPKDIQYFQNFCHMMRFVNVNKLLGGNRAWWYHHKQYVFRAWHKFPFLCKFVTLYSINPFWKTTNLCDIVIIAVAPNSCVGIKNIDK